MENFSQQFKTNCKISEDFCISFELTLKIEDIQEKYDGMLGNFVDRKRREKRISIVLVTGSDSEKLRITAIRPIEVRI